MRKVKNMSEVLEGFGGAGASLLQSVSLRAPPVAAGMNARQAHPMPPR